jgi:hypothetical protein
MPKYPLFDFRLMSNESLIENIKRPLTYLEILEHEDIISNMDRPDDLQTISYNKFVVDNKVYNNIFELVKEEVLKMNNITYKIPIQILVIKNEIASEPFYFWRNAELNDEIIDILLNKFLIWCKYLYNNRCYAIYN